MNKNKSLIANFVVGVFILLNSQNLAAQFCSVDYLDPSSISFSAQGGFELVEVGGAEFCEVDVYDVPSWLEVNPSFGGYIDISCSQNTGSARYATIGVGVNGYPEDYLYISQASGLTGGSISISTTSVCYGESPGSFSNDSSPSGGECSGNYSYQWQSSTNGSYYSNISGATSQTYSPGYLYSSKYFRRKVTCSTSTAYSNAIQINVNSIIVGGDVEISGESSSTLYISSRDTLPDFINTSAASGGSGGIEYQWRYSVNLTNPTWIHIPGATSSSYSPEGPQIQSRVYSRFAIDNKNCENEASTRITIHVSDEFSISISHDDEQNYIHSVFPLIPINSQSLNDMDSLFKRSTDYLIHNIDYFDGLGRPIQNISVSASPNLRDIIQPLVYDDYGREAVRYLPYESNSDIIGAYDSDAIGTTYGSNSEQYKFYNIYTNDVVDDPYPYSVSVFEESPLNRITEQGSNGGEWQPYDASITGSGHTLKYEWGTNSSNNVLKFYIVGDELRLNTSSDKYYSEGELYKTIIKNENWSSGSVNTTEEYKDKLGQIILKRTYIGSETVETHYVYDALGLLRYVITPVASDSISNRSYQFPMDKTNTIIQNLCYYYKYDARKRMVEKQLPGSDPVWMVYDERDRLVLLQDGNMREKRTPKNKVWLFTKYDQLNRPVMTGEYTHPDTVLCQKTMQTYFDNQSNPLYESYYEGTGNVFRYNNESFPDISTDEVYTVIYYDNYDFDDETTAGYDRIQLYVESIDNTDYPASEITYNVKGGITGTLTRILDDNVASQSDDMVLTATFYDDKSRVIRTYSENHLGGHDLIANKYDFTGKVLKTRRDHYMSASSDLLTIEKNYTYDHIGRLLTTFQEIIDDGNSQGTDTISKMNYNELGELISKQLGVTTSGQLQKIDYEYNIKGWLTEINDGEVGGTDSDKFGLILNYEEDLTGTNAPSVQNQYNGNISAMLWESDDDSISSSYIFRYDDLNRLDTADYYILSGTSWSTSSSYDLSGISYDLNGNILSLIRNGQSGSSIDDLAYAYQNGTHWTNILQSIVDDDGDQGVGDFPGVASTSYTYSYDLNGNMVSDEAKGIDTIYYNYLNLPENIIFGTTDSIDYTYDATGIKVRKKVRKMDDDSVTITKRHYLNGLEYNESSSSVFTLALIHMDEGYIEYANGNYDYNYTLKDHLGNTRVVVTDNSGPDVVQEIDYYPFGMQFDNSYADTEFDYLFNGKELQDDLIGSVNLNLYDFHTRYYDPVIGRFTTVDPMAHEREWLSPYNFVQNNPINRIDPDGALDKGYTLDDEGNIEEIEGQDANAYGGNEYDILFNKSEYEAGNTAESKGLRVDNTQILTDLSKTNDKSLSISKDHTTGSINDVFKVFKFASDNTNVEWALARYSNTQYAIWTNKDQGNAVTQSVNSPKTVGLSNVNASLHSHPDILLQHERSSMGAATGGGYYPRSDWGNKIAGSRPYYMAVYFPDSKNIYSISKYKISFIRNIGNDYKRFYYGALNHK